MTAPIVIVGAGLGGVRAAQALRQEGYDGGLVLIGDEPSPSYERPELSKAVLSGAAWTPPRLCSPEEFSALVVTSIHTRARAIDHRTRSVALSDGTALPAIAILLATGARARLPKLPGVQSGNVFSLRTQEDAEALRAQLKPGRALVVMGGGLIGCEVATTASALGLSVTILEAGPELLERALGAQLGHWVRRRLEAKGVVVRLDAKVIEIEGAPAATAVVLRDETRVVTDLVVISVGAEPVTDIAAAAGATCNAGIVVAASGRTSIEGIFAIGDAAAWPLRGGGRRSLESFLNTQAQARVAARSMLGLAAAEPQIPTSWTEIAGQTIQVMGDLRGEGELVFRCGSYTASFLAFRLHAGAIAAAAAIDAPRDFAVARRLVEAAASVDPAALADTSAALRGFLRPAAASAEQS
jgi:NADPH-dependent 2,4-dienoyl-CoA reductase/sulfur reductase-like enzyme